MFGLPVVDSNPGLNIERANFAIGGNEERFAQRDAGGTDTTELRRPFQMPGRASAA